MNTDFARGMCRRAENATSSTESVRHERCARAFSSRPRRAQRPVVARRAPYQWTLATRSRSAFIHDGRVNGVRDGSPHSAVVAHVREKMARRRDGDRSRAKSAGRTSVVMVIRRAARARGRACGSEEARRSGRAVRVTLRTLLVGAHRAAAARSVLPASTFSAR